MGRADFFLGADPAVTAARPLHSEAAEEVEQQEHDHHAKREHERPRRAHAVRLRHLQDMAINGDLRQVIFYD